MSAKIFQYNMDVREDKEICVKKINSETSLFSGWHNSTQGQNCLRLLLFSWIAAGKIAI